MKVDSGEARDWREGRRLRAYELSQQGWKQAAIAQGLGVTEGAVSQWLARARTGGVDARKRRTSPGAPPKLTREQKARLPQLLLRGAPAFGFTGDVWTAPRVAAVIEREWQVTYHPDYVCRLLHVMSAACFMPAAGAARSRSRALTSAMKKPSRSGGSSGFPP